MLHGIHDSGAMSIEYLKGFSTTHLELVILSYVVRIIVFFLISVFFSPPEVAKPRSPRANIMPQDPHSLVTYPCYFDARTTLQTTRHPDPTFWSEPEILSLAQPIREMTKASSSRSIAKM
jgi:hypothetical protein